MPFPLIPVIIVASSVLVGGTIIVTIVYNIGRAKVKVKPAIKIKQMLLFYSLEKPKQEKIRL